MPKIPGGYYIKARKIQESAIAHAPPHVREIWDWLIKEANFKGNKKIKRGQVLTRYDDIRDGLHWMVGYRKEQYSKSQCEIAMKWLTKHTMIRKTKTTRGLIVTILNYEQYQEPKNYENHIETYKRTTREPQRRHTILKEREELNNKEKAKSGNGTSQKEKDYKTILKGPDWNENVKALVSKYAWSGESWDEFKVRIGRELTTIKREVRA